MGETRSGSAKGGTQVCPCLREMKPGRLKGKDSWKKKKEKEAKKEADRLTKKRE